MNAEERIRADERREIAEMLRSWAESTRRNTASDYEFGYYRAFLKASRLVGGEEE